MTITFTLASGSSATAAGPFNISGTTDGGSSNTILIATGITKTQLVTGHTVTNVTPENITGGTIASTGTCTTTTPWYVTPPAETATLAWSFTENAPARGFMNIYVNGSIVIDRNITSSGTYTVYEGDEISVEVNSDECGLSYTYAECSGIINDLACAEGGAANISTEIYTVNEANLGTTLYLTCLSECSQEACLN
jgi:hypothetical protein